MFGLSQARQKTIAGIDISSAAVKVIVLGPNKQGFQVDGYSVVPLPEGAVTEGKINEAEIVGNAVSKAVAKARAGSQRAGAVSVPSSQVITKVIQVPSGLGDAELESLVEAEADQHIPHAIEEVAIDFVVLGPNDRNPDFDDLLLVACRKEYVDDRVAALDLAGIKVEVVDVEAYAVARAFRLVGESLGLDQGSVVALLDIGAASTSLTVLHDDDVVYSREQAFGGKHLTQEIQRRYGMSFEEAGYAKKIGGLPDDYELEVLGPFKQALLQQIERSLTWFFKAGTYDSVDLIVLAGGTASLPDLDLFVQQQTQVQTVLANPFADMKISKGIDVSKLAEDAPALLLATGLALRGGAK